MSDEERMVTVKHAILLSEVIRSNTDRANDLEDCVRKIYTELVLCRVNKTEKECISEMITLCREKLKEQRK